MLRYLVKGIICFSALLCATTSFAEFKSAPLTVEQAFSFSASIKKPHELVAEWHIAPGYYLYAKRIHINFTPTVAATFSLPQGHIKYDKVNGPSEVFSGTLAVPIILKTDVQTVKLRVDYQGCSQRGFCYPPMHKEVLLNLVTRTVEENNRSSTTTFSQLMTNQNEVQTLLDQQHFSVMLLFFLGIGLLLAFTPCVLPMIPILTSIIVGQRQPVSTRKAFSLSLIYVLGTALTYAIAGLIAASLGSSLQVALQQPWIIAGGAIVFVLLALSLFGFYELRLPRAWHNHLTHLSNRQRGGTYAGVFMMGMLSTLIVSPCVTAPLVGTLMFISNTGNLLFGASALFVMGIGMGIPLLLIGMSAGKWLPKSGSWMEIVKKIFGVLMLAMAIWMLARILPSIIIVILSAILLLGVAAYVGKVLPHLIGYRKLNRSLGALLGVLAIFTLVSSGINPSFVEKTFFTKPATQFFIVVRNMNELDQQLTLASAAKKPVIIDFYADWCESCIAMDKTVFAEPSVKQKLNNYVLLRADLSDNTPDEAMILKKFAVIAPPTVLFFDPYGNESDAQRIVGEVNAQEFLQRLHIFAEANCSKKVQC